MAIKVYAETSVVLCASMWFKIGGKTLKHWNYDKPYNLLQYAELCRDQGVNLFYTTPSIIQEAHLKLDKALGRMIGQQLDASKISDSKRLLIMAQFASFLYDCLDQMDNWFSLFQQEGVPQRQKDDVTLILQNEFRTCDVEFRQKNGPLVDNAQNVGLHGLLKKAADSVRKFQLKDVLKEYKPNPGSVDISIMAEVAAINLGLGNEVYLVSEDGHFCAKQNRKLLEEKAGIKTRRSEEMLEGGTIRDLIAKANPPSN